MAKGIFFKLAKNNILRNKRLYLPYFIASAALIAVYFMVQMIINCRSIGNLSYSGSLISTFKMCSQITTLVIVPFMLYVNSFIIKGRKKEFALYGILGLEKRHVSRVIIWEGLFISLSSLITGLVTGVVFGRLVFMLMIRVFGEMARGTTFSLSPQAFYVTFIVFGAVFSLSIIYNLCHVNLAKPVDLLKGKAKREKRVRFVLPLTVIGLGLLAWAYYTALTSENSYQAINSFFIAAGAVIIATYLLFIAGSVFILDFLRKRERLYYKPGNFITIGSLRHRLKQNAAGLATICVLASMVIATVSITTSIYMGQEDMVVQNNPNDVEIVSAEPLSSEEAEALKAAAYSLGAENNVQIEDYLTYDYLSCQRLWQEREFKVVDEEAVTYKDLDDRMTLEFVSLEDYNRIMGENRSLNQREVVVLSNEDLNGLTTLKTNSGDYKVAAVTADTPFSLGKNAPQDSLVVFVATDPAVLYRDFNGAAATDPAVSLISLNIEGEEDDCLSFSAALRGYTTDNRLSDSFKDIYSIRQEGHGLFGGILFVGVFFSLVFLTAAVVIIYFKQVSEGYEDKERFQILQKVGMSQKAVKSTINRQILLVFFLPLLMALIHISVAVPLITNMLASVFLTNTLLTLGCVAATAIAFSLVYVVVYRLTAGVYYHLVRL
ncbi:MAG: ABC transporter permease [Bacillota bacterium]|nr:ABC transporter permease [Bacillota bacterium]